MGTWIGMAIMENTMKVLKKVKNKLPYDPTIPLLCIISKGNKNHYGKKISATSCVLHYSQELRYGGNPSIC